MSRKDRIVTDDNIKIETTVLCNCHKSDKSVENDRKKK